MSESGGTADEAVRDRPRVVVGVDGSEISREVLVEALLAAGRRAADLDVVCSVVAEVYYLGGAPLPVPDVRRMHDDAHDRVRSLVDEVRADAEVSAVPGVRDVGIRLAVPERAAAPELVDRSRDALLLVVGSRGRGAGRSAVLGSVALHCATHALCPVVVVHSSAVVRSGPPRIVVGVDGSDASRMALAEAVTEAARRRGVVEVVSGYRHTDYWTDLASVMVPPEQEVREGLEARARELVDAVLAEKGGTDVPPVRIEVHEGPPGEVLIRQSRGADLLVVGSRGRGAFLALLLGSIALHCAMHADCPVMVVRPVGTRGGADRADPAMALR